MYHALWYHTTSLPSALGPEASLTPLQSRLGNETHQKAEKHAYLRLLVLSATVKTAVLVMLINKLYV